MSDETRDRKKYEREQHALNPHRTEERRKAMAETMDRLEARGIKLDGRETSDDLADLLTAVETFEESVTSRGGDLMMDDLRSSQPTDPDFVLPRRNAGEAVRAYIERVHDAIRTVRRRPER